MAIDLQTVPPDKQTYAMCYDSVMTDWRQLRYVSAKNQTEEMCLKAVQQSGCALQYIEEQTPELCLTAVKQFGGSLQYVQHKTPEICAVAVKQYENALEYVPEELQTPEMCLEAVKKMFGSLGMQKNRLLRCALRRSGSAG